MLQRISLSVLICFLLITSLLSTNLWIGHASEPFSDIKNSWAKEQISDWFQKELISGYPDQTFRANNKITRAEFVSIINKVIGYKEYSYEEFKDVSKNKWYYKEISKARRGGYILGYDDGTFRPEQSISREETATIIYRLMKLDKIEDNNLSTDYKDSKKVHTWAKDAVSTLVANGYMIGYPDQTLRPEHSITRAEAIVMLDRVTGKLITASGTYGPSDHQEIVNGNVTINTDDVTLKNTVIKGDLYLVVGIGDGEVYLDNVTVEGRTIVNGGGSIDLKGEFKDAIIKTKVNLVIHENTKIENLEVEGEAEGTTIYTQKDSNPGGGNVVSPPISHTPTPSPTPSEPQTDIEVLGVFIMEDKLYAKFSSTGDYSSYSWTLNSTVTQDVYQAKHSSTIGDMGVFTMDVGVLKGADYHVVLENTTIGYEGVMLSKKNVVNDVYGYVHYAGTTNLSFKINNSYHVSDLNQQIPEGATPLSDGDVLTLYYGDYLVLKTVWNDVDKKWRFYILDNSPVIWMAYDMYHEGTKVVYKGKIYEARWWNQNFPPDKPVENSWDLAWKLSDNQVLPVRNVTATAWETDKIYDLGDRVAYNGLIYEAKWYTQGFVPDTPVGNFWETPWKVIWFE